MAYGAMRGCEMKEMNCMNEMKDMNCLNKGTFGEP